MTKISRKKFQEALKALKAACKNPNLPFTLRVRAAELILCAYNVPLPGSTYRPRRAVKELVEEGSFDRQLQKQVQEKVRQDAEAQARAFLGRVRNAPIEENSGINN